MTIIIMKMIILIMMMIVQYVCVYVLICNLHCAVIVVCCSWSAVLMNRKLLEKKRRKIKRKSSRRSLRTNWTIFTIFVNFFFFPFLGCFLRAGEYFDCVQCASPLLPFYVSFYNLFFFSAHIVQKLLHEHDFTAQMVYTNILHLV